MENPNNKITPFMALAFHRLGLETVSDVGVQAGAGEHTTRQNRHYQGKRFIDNINDYSDSEIAEILELPEEVVVNQDYLFFKKDYESRNLLKKINGLRR